MSARESAPLPSQRRAVCASLHVTASLVPALSVSLVLTLSVSLVSALYVSLAPALLFVCFPGCRRCCLAGRATWQHFKEREILTNYARSCCAQTTNTWRKRLLKPKNSQGAWLWFGFGTPVNRKETALFIQSFFGFSQEDCTRTAKGTDRAPRRRAWEERN